jgi:hypothetical protein
MTKQEKFAKIIEFLKGLKPEQFRYDDIVAEYDKSNNCGTVCCVLGWFPAIFPTNYSWANSEFGDWMRVVNTVFPTEMLESFLDIPSTHETALFYGGTKCQLELGLPIVKISGNLSQVIHLFEEYYRLYVLPEAG